jgi:hypothetical protein
MSRRNEAVDVLVGVTAIGVRGAGGTARIAVSSARLAGRVPVVGPRLRRVTNRVAAEGRGVRSQASVQLDRVLAAPELPPVVDRVVAGPLTDMVAQSLARNGVPQRVAAEFLAAGDMDAAAVAVLEHPRTRELLEAVAASAAFQQIVADAIDSSLTVEMTDRLLQSPAMQHAIDHLAASPELRRAVAEQSAGMAEQTLEGVRRRSVVLDDAAERTVRGWLRRPRPQPS